jgi:hypothetical protein
MHFFFGAASVRGPWRMRSNALDKIETILVRRKSEGPEGVHIEGETKEAIA